MDLRGVGLGDGQEGLAGERAHGEGIVIVVWGEVKDCNKRKDIQEG